MAALHSAPWGRKRGVPPRVALASAASPNAPSPTVTSVYGPNGLDTGKRGGPEPEQITLESFGREIPEA